MLDAHVDVTVYLPPLGEDGASAELRGEGSVVRVEEKAEGMKGFAAAVNFRAEPAGGANAVDRGKLF